MSQNQIEMALICHKSGEDDGRGVSLPATVTLSASNHPHIEVEGWKDFLYVLFFDFFFATFRQP